MELFTYPRIEGVELVFKLGIKKFKKRKNIKPMYD